MVDPTAIEIDFDPTVQRMKGVTVHGGMPFDVPIISEIGPNLWQGGCQDGLILPCFVRHLVSLYLWEHYRGWSQPVEAIELARRSVKTSAGVR